MQESFARTRQLLLVAQQRQAAYYNKKHRQVDFAVDARVLLNSKNLALKHDGSRKLLPKWCGPFKVLARIGPVAYRLELPVTWRCHNVFHVSLLKQYTSGRTSPPPPVMLDGSWEFTIETIIGHRNIFFGRLRKDGTRPSKKEYLIKWLGYAQEHNSWEPEDELFNESDLQDSEIVERYWRNPNDLTRPPQPRR